MTSDGSAAPGVACRESGCPFNADGRCLEAFDPPSGCPHLTEDPNDRNTGEHAELAPEAGIFSDSTPPIESRPAEQLVGVGGSQALSRAQASVAAKEHGALLVLLCGAHDSGKSSLVVELYARFLKGPFGGWAFAGSKTLIAFDAGHFHTRLASGEPRADTVRTSADDEGILHLLLSNAGHRLPLFITDYRGERFDNIADGVAASDELGVVARVDVTLVLLDGAKLANKAQRRQVFTWLHSLIGGLTEPFAVPDATKVALIVNKKELLTPEDIEWVGQRCDTAAAFARDRGLDPEVLWISARPHESPDNPQGLEVVLAFIASRPHTVAAPRVKPAGRRHMLRFGEIDA